ncbi:unnamed protein product [Durusdinium trenchii]|uniref:Thiaminase-2/PQQC domain-containing protein n=2 Tax=Durusdinium trenchii TaxID=1381693 RepID=A0ABP0QSA4_9DINO
MASTGSRFSETLREAARDQWNRVVHHRWTKDLAKGTLDLKIMRRYLIQDHRFLDSFVVLLASMVAHARCLEDRIFGCQFLALTSCNEHVLWTATAVFKVTGKENTYFERCFAVLPRCKPAEREQVPDASCTKGFKDLMLEVAKTGTLGEMLAVLLVCEWTYLSWAQAVEEEALRENFVLYEWIDLHTCLVDVVAYLQRLLDKEGELLTAAERQRCHDRFLQAVQLEEDFFENAYALEESDE